MVSREEALNRARKLDLDLVEVFLEISVLNVFNI